VTALPISVAAGLATLLVAASGGALAEGKRLEAWAYRYDAGHDVLPDWIWNRGLPGNPYHQSSDGRIVRAARPELATAPPGSISAATSASFSVRGR
jgi:hypothetical protein